MLNGTALNNTPDNNSLSGSDKDNPLVLVWILISQISVAIFLMAIFVSLCYLSYSKKKSDKKEDVKLEALIAAQKCAPTTVTPGKKIVQVDNSSTHDLESNIPGTSGTQILSTIPESEESNIDPQSLTTVIVDPKNTTGVDPTQTTKL